jgi:hypothetical protein
VSCDAVLRPLPFAGTTGPLPHPARLVLIVPMWLSGGSPVLLSALSEFLLVDLVSCPSELFPTL